MGITSLARVKARLLADPSLINVRRAAARFLARREKCGLETADYQLYHLRDSVEVDKVFKRVLPEVHARERGTVFERRERFFQAISERFPVDWDYLDYCYMETGDDEETGACSFFDYGIMTPSMRPFHAWAYRSAWLKLPLAYRLADVLFDAHGGHRESDDAFKHWNFFAKEYDLPRSLKPAAGKADKDLLFSSFENHRSPLRFLPLAAKVLGYTTGCFFLDYDEDDGTEALEWTFESVSWLTEQAKLGRQIEGQIERLDAWLEEDPEERIARAFRLYHKFRRLINGKQKNRLRIGASAEGRALVGIL